MEKDGTRDEVKTTCEYVLDLCNRLEETCKLSQEELQKYQAVSKKIYDKSPKCRVFQSGDKVSVLLPTEANKLLISWKRPYDICQERASMTTM